jgi:hypothetical protein
VTCSDEEAFKLVEDSTVTAGHVVDMLGVDMSLGKTMHLSTSSIYIYAIILSRMERLFAYARYAMGNLWSCLIMNYLFLFLFHITQYRQTGLFSMRAVYSSYDDSESCQKNVLDLIWFIDKGFALVLAQS